MTGEYFGSGGRQEQLVEAGSVSTNTVSKVVWVVTGNFPDDPHPHVLGVYDNEAAAKEHSKAIRDSIKPSEPVAWGVTEMDVESEPLRGDDSR